MAYHLCPQAKCVISVQACPENVKNYPEIRFSSKLYLISMPNIIKILTLNLVLCNCDTGWRTPKIFKLTWKWFFLVKLYLISVQMITKIWILKLFYCAVDVCRKMCDSGYSVTYPENTENCPEFFSKQIVFDFYTSYY